MWDVALGENQNAVAVSSNKRAAQHTCDPLLYEYVACTPTGPGPSAHNAQAVLLYSRLGRINRSTPLMDLESGIVVGRISPSRHYFFEMASPLKVPPAT